YAGPSSPRLRVVSKTDEVHHDTIFRSYDPRVVSGRQRHRIPRAELDLASIVHDGFHSSRKNITEVRCLTGFGFHDGLDALGPLPTWFERGTSYRRASYRNDVESALWK